MADTSEFVPGRDGRPPPAPSMEETLDGTAVDEPGSDATGDGTAEWSPDAVDRDPTVIGDEPVDAGAENGDVRRGLMLAKRYLIKRKIGFGGMGTVWEAEHVRIGRNVALKALRADLGHADRDRREERFMQEARIASSIRHENVVDITDFGTTPRGLPFFVMELLKGQPLADLIGHGRRLPWKRAKSIVLQLCRAMHHAHDQNVIHRDLKPRNIFLVERHGDPDFVKIIDFGIAKFHEVDAETRAITRVGAVVGSPGYMSPEQALALELDPRADIYSLGCILYEMVTGERPFADTSSDALMCKHMFEEPTWPRVLAPNAGIDHAVEAIIMRALRKDRALRFSNMVEFARAVEDVGTGAASVHVPREQLGPPSAETARAITKVPGGDHGTMIALGGGPAPPARLTAPTMPVGTVPPRRRVAAWTAAAVAVAGALGVGAVALHAGSREDDGKATNAADGPETPNVTPARVEPVEAPPAIEAQEDSGAGPESAAGATTTSGDAKGSDEPMSGPGDGRRKRARKSSEKPKAKPAAEPPSAKQPKRPKRPAKKLETKSKSNPELYDPFSG